jgi:hypothetical protein
MSERYLSLDAGRVRFDIERLMEAYPELADDDQLRAGMLEGETEIASVVTRIFRSLKEDEAQADGAKAFKDDLAARQKRFENRAARKRSLIMSVMDAADLPKLDLPVATFSVRDPQPVVAVDVEPHELPQGFFKTTHEARKTEIKKALMAGEDVPGARLEFGSASLHIRGA